MDNIHGERISDRMVKEKVLVNNKTGLHLKPAGVLCNEAIKYQASITFRIRTSTANVKSVLSVLAACVKPGEEIEFFCEGPDEAEALAGVVAVVKNNFGEKEE